MPLFLGAKGKDILQWRACAELVTSFKETLSRRWDRVSARESESLLNSLRERLEEELGYEEDLRQELSALDDGIGRAGSIQELQSLRKRYRELVSAHFGRRRSVLALFELCNRLHDSSLAKAVSLATERMRELGQGEPPRFALFVSGARARGEETLRSRDRYLILHEQESPSFILFARQLSIALKDAGLIDNEQLLWHGSVADWRSSMQAAFAPGKRRDQEAPAAPLLPFPIPTRERSQDLPDWEWYLEAMTDLLHAHGDAALAGEALQATAALLAEVREQGPFRQLERRVIALPLAVGRFGRWRTVREGEHEGEIDLEESALAPLAMTVRILAISARTPAGGTLQRIEALVVKGVLSVELAERLLKAFQRLMQEKILSEMRGGATGAFCNPAKFDQAEEELFRGSIETVLNLQKIAYQRMVGQV